jgi:drug/metabolite transporter (DMT)-like permease
VIEGVAAEKNVNSYRKMMLVGQLISFVLFLVLGIAYTQGIVSPSLLGYLMLLLVVVVFVFSYAVIRRARRQVRITGIDTATRARAVTMMRRQLYILPIFLVLGLLITRDKPWLPKIVGIAVVSLFWISAFTRLRSLSKTDVSAGS